MVGRGSDCSCVLIENGQWLEEDPIDPIAHVY